MAGRCQSGEAGTDHDYVSVRHLVEASAELRPGPPCGGLSTGRFRGRLILPSLRGVTRPPVQDATIPLVEGLRLTERAEDTGSGELWYARVTGGLGGEHGDPVPGELPGVGECLLRLLRIPVDEALRSRARALAGDLVALEDPGVVGVRFVRDAHDGVALILAPLQEPVLALSILARRRQLAAGEIVTLGVAVAWALAAEHRKGLTHGRLRDADVLIDAAGRPLLGGVGVAGVLGAPGVASADVEALERLLGSLLDGSSRGAAKVGHVLEDRSLTAAELAAALAAATPALAIDSGVAAGDVEPPPHAGRRPGRGRLPAIGPRARRVGLLVAGGAGILLLAGVAGWASGSSPEAGKASPAPPAASRVADPNWTALLRELDGQRSAAFARPGTVPIAAIDAPSGAAFGYDSKALAVLRERAVHAAGLQLAVERVTVTTRADRRVILAVTDRRLPYELRDSSNGLVTRIPGRATARHVIELRDTASGRTPQWRIWKVTDAAGRPS